MSVNPKILIIDYGFGNLFSIVKAFKYLGTEVTISDSSQKIKDSRAVVLPGVGAFGDGIKGLKERNFIEPIINFANSERPLLGICLGMQFLFEYSTEFGQHKGLGLIKGKVEKIPEFAKDGTDRYKIPHIGWNELLFPPERKNWDNTIFSHLKEHEQVYFVHSYAGFPEEKKDILANTEYGGNIITAAVQRNNIMGTQFHPEKSGETGLKILRQFIKII
jgi:glutamine amidotransferase